MGILEDKTRKRKRRNNIKNILLATISSVGLLGVAVVAPGVLVSMKKLGLVPGKRSGEVIKNCRNRLVKQGYLKYEGNFLRITQKGSLELAISSGKIAATPKKWDKKWRVLIFDVVERKRKTREKIRMTLRAVGFVRLQDSVWVYPYPCEEFITLLKADFMIGKELIYMIVEEIENDKNLKKTFGLLEK